MENKTSLFVKIGYVYLILPIIIFFIGYCRPLISIPSIILILISTYFLFKNSPKLWKPENKKQWFIVASIAVISFIWVYSSGIGALVFQNSDHICRNAIFEILVKYKWPVIDSQGDYILTYYTGFWMVPAIIGKLFNSIQAGYLAQILWGSIGVFLVFYYFLASLKSKNLIPVIVFIFFSGMDYLGIKLFEFMNIYHTEGITEHLEWWFGGFQFSSMTTQLYWVFNQALPAWVLTMLLYHQKNNKSILFLYSCVFLCSTLPAIGIFPFVFYWCLRNGVENIKKIFSFDCFKNTVLSVFSIENIIGVMIILPVTYLYLSSNISGGSYGAIRIDPFRIIGLFGIFIMLEVGIYLILTYKTNKKDPLFFISTTCFCTYPFYYIGFGADFCMRATIPALVILVLLILKSLEDKEFRSNNKIAYTLLIISLLIGSITPIHEIARTIVNTSQGITKQKPELSINNFFGYIEGNKFIKYLSKNIK